MLEIDKGTYLEALLNGFDGFKLKFQAISYCCEKVEYVTKDANGAVRFRFFKDLEPHRSLKKS